MMRSCLGRQAQLAALAAQGRDGEVDDVAEAEAVKGEGADPAVAVPDLHGPGDLHEAAAAFEALHARLQDGVHPGGGAAVKDGKLLGVHFNAEVLNFKAGQGGEQVLDGLEPNAILHQGGGQDQVAGEIGPGGAVLGAVVLVPARRPRPRAPGAPSRGGCHADHDPRS